MSSFEANIHQFDPTAISSKGLVYLGDELLIYRRGPEAPTHPLFLDVPGGRTEEGETPFQTFQREVNEEFGLTISPETITWARGYHLENHLGKTAYFLVSHLPDTRLDDVRFGDEGIEYMAMSPLDFVKRVDVYQPFIDRTKEYLNSLD